MKYKNLFLFGAGASHGAQSVLPYAPPLMNGLYAKLANCYPQQWGLNSQMDSFKEEFIEDFEKAYSRRILKEDDPYVPSPPDSLTLAEGQRALAFYFSKFTLTEDRQDYYSKILSVLIESDLLSKSFFTSLNFDCLFELSAIGQNLQVNWLLDENDSADIKVCKIHGSCNFITEELPQQYKALMTTGSLEGKITALNPIRLREQLRAKISKGMPNHLPVICQTSPKKQTVYGSAKIQNIKNKWSQAVESSQSIVVIGVSYNLNDTHIIDSIRLSRAERIYYIGSSEDFCEWQNLNSNFQHLGKTLGEGFPSLRKVLKNGNRSRV